MNFIEKFKLALRGMSVDEIEKLAKKARNFKKKEYDDDLLEKMK
jgi:hypothetical protein